MTDSPLRLALRELQTDMRRPVTWAVLVGVGLVLSVAGAFGTADVMRPVPSAVYWVGIVTVTYGAGSFAANVLRFMFPDLPTLARIGVMGLGAGLAVTATIVGLNTAIFGPAFVDEPGGLIRFVAATMAVAFIVTAVIDLAVRSAGQNQTPDPQQTDDHGTAQPALLSRLPLDKRGAILSLTAVDHYVEVTTSAGQDLVLIRLTDAINETAPQAGFRIHRSHWVAQTAIAAVMRDGATGTVTLCDGRSLPVSRTYLPDLKDAGLFAKGAK